MILVCFMSFLEKRGFYILVLYENTSVAVIVYIHHPDHTQNTVKHASKGTSI